MVNQNYHTVFFQPVGYNDNTFTSAGNSYVQSAPFRSQVTYKINEYIFRGIAYIKYILELIISSSPFIEQYSPIIRELPKMYTLVKAFKEIQSEELDDNDVILEKNDSDYLENTYPIGEPVPTLFI